jgi:hypothetical protein
MTLATSRLRRLAQAPPAAPAAEQEHCDLCGLPVPAEHRHMLDLRSREPMCACQACSILFDSAAAGAGHYRLIPRRRLRLDDFVLDDLMWEELRLPVDMAFFFHNTAAERVSAYYPSPMGPTESLLTFDAWQALEAANPILLDLAPDVEALLVDRARGARRQWLVPIDDCYALVGLIRTRWRGFTGGKEVWAGIAEFFDALDRRSRPATTPRASAERG